ncbi:MAG: SDR family oxidoreductase [Pseudomonadales bacterium]|nr:SDR family oxidoreductase [Pseudomonadales bacterium]MCP5185993.1 SDR family oxidoreductase [Pseudomonadales bacterium]
MGHLDGKRIVITGSTRGLGRAFAEEMARAGARVVVNGTQAALVDEVVAGIRAAGGTAIGLAGSIAEESTAARLVAACVDNWGGIDTIVHNAGIVRDKTLLKMTAEEFDDVIAVHLRGAFFCIKHAGIAMKAGGGGHIILVISGSGLAGGFGQGNYAAAKEGMMGLLRTAALELTKSGIRCNALWPIAETDMTQVVFERAAATAEAAGQPAPRPVDMGFGKPREVAQGMVWLASDKAAHLQSQCVTFNGRKTALWSHPAETGVTFHAGPWSVEDLAAHYAEVAQQPIWRPRMVE